MPFFKNSGINIYYEIAGEGVPLLLINGLAADTRQWEPLINKLKKNYKIVCYDMRCAGRSDKPDVSFTIDDLSEEAFGLMQHLQISKFNVLGFSMGGMIAMNLALKHSEVINKMFLVATAPSIKKPYPPSDDVLKMISRTDVSPKLLSLVYEAIFGSDYKKKISLNDFIRFRMSDDNPQPAFAYVQQLNALEKFDINDDVNKIKTPSVIITGLEDKLIPFENSVWLNNELKNSRLYKLDKVGHMVPVEAVDQLAKILILS